MQNQVKIPVIYPKAGKGKIKPTQESSKNQQPNPRNPIGNGSS